MTQEQRSALLAIELEKFYGKVVNKEMLFGRGYFLEEDGKVVENHFPHIEELYFEPEEDEEYDDDEDRHITCKDAQEYVAMAIGQNFDDEFYHWIKCIPAEPEDVDNREVYMVIIIEAKKGKTDDEFEIKRISVHCRMINEIGGGWLSIPGVSTLDSHFFEMDLIPPEPVKEVESLVNGRFIPEGFTFIGKPMPKNMDNFWPAKNSGYRNIYWHITVEHDDNDIITDIDTSTYEREVSMFQRPHSMDPDTLDYFDAALHLCSFYSDEEWADIIKQ